MNFSLLNFKKLQVKCILNCNVDGREYRFNKTIIFAIHLLYLLYLNLFLQIFNKNIALILASLTHYIIMYDLYTLEMKYLKEVKNRVKMFFDSILNIESWYKLNYKRIYFNHEETYISKLNVIYDNIKLFSSNSDKNNLVSEEESNKLALFMSYKHNLVLTFISIVEDSIYLSYIDLKHKLNYLKTNNCLITIEHNIKVILENKSNLDTFTNGNLINNENSLSLKNKLLWNHIDNKLISINQSITKMKLLTNHHEIETEAIDTINELSSISNLLKSKFLISNFDYNDKITNENKTIQIENKDNNFKSLFDLLDKEKEHINQNDENIYDCNQNKNLKEQLDFYSIDKDSRNFYQRYDLINEMNDLIEKSNTRIDELKIE